MKQLFYTCIVLLISNSLTAQSLKPWKVGLPAGKQFNVLTTMNAKISQEVMGQHIDIDMDVNTTDSVLVKSETNNSFNLSKVTAKMKMNMTAMGKEVNFDSDKKEDMESEMGQKLKEKLGVAVEATVNEKGQVKILSEKKEENAADAMSSIMPMNNDSAAVAGLFLIPPQQSLKQGESWKDSVSSPEMSILNTYTFDKTENGIANISFSTVSNTTGTATTNGMEVTVKLKTETSGTLKVSTKTGLVLERKATMKMEGTSEVMGMQIPITGTSTMATTTAEF
ncbi:MAG: DUF6263 family protein [Lacibacter sp.]